MPAIPFLILSTAFVCQSAPTISSPVGNGQQGYSGDGGPAAEAKLDQPFDVAFDRDGHLYLSDTYNHRIRRVDAKTGVITTVVGNGQKGFSGDGGPATDAKLDEPYGLAFDADGHLYFADRLNTRVRRVDAKTGVITTVAGNGSKEYSGDGGPGASAGLVEPNGVAFDHRKNRLLIADVAGHRVRALDLATGKISTFTGNGQPSHDGDGGKASDASVRGPRAVAVSRLGDVYILERDGHSLRKVGYRYGLLVTLAGTGEKGYSGDGGPARDATLNSPKELELDPQDNVYIVDSENHVIRRIDAQTRLITTVAGCGRNGGKGDGGPATSAELDSPHGVAVAPDDSLWIGDTTNHRIRRVSPP